MDKVRSQPEESSRGTKEGRFMSTKNARCCVKKKEKKLHRWDKIILFSFYFFFYLLLPFETQRNAGCVMIAVTGTQVTDKHMWW